MSWISVYRRNHPSFVYPQPFLVMLLALLLVPHANALKGHVTRHRHHQSGDEYGGQQPISGSRVYLFAISTMGYGSTAQSLLTGQGVSYDSAGNGYIVSDADGGFNISDLYVNNCPSNDAYVYLQALSGNPGDGSDNSAIDLVSVMPSTCMNLPNAPSVNINELTTVAAAWGMLRYANWGMLRYANASILSLSASNENPQALQNAVNYTNGLVSGFTATVGTTAQNGSLTIPGSTINAMGDIIAQCVNASATSFHCTSLFALSLLPGGVEPTDTLQAAIGIALNPSADPGDLFNLIPAQPPFPTGLTNSPSSWTITYGISSGAAQQASVITIDHTKVSTNDQINFPVAISVPPNNNLKSVSNGGYVQSLSGYDILFSSDSAGQNLLDFEIDSYNPNTGAATFWVRIPDLKHTSDTVIYAWYGIPSITTSLENSLGVWSDNYLSVYHFGSGSVLGTLDSAIAGYPLYGIASPGQGIFGGSATFNGDPTSFLYHDGVPAYPSGSSAVTLEAWEQTSSPSGLVGSSGSDIVGYGGLNNLGAVGIIDYGVGFGLNFSGAFDGYYLGSSNDSNWHQMVGVYGGGNVTSPSTVVYYDGQSASEGYASGTPSITTDELTIGQYPQVRGCCTVIGSVDEVRISSVSRSADWIATEFNNQSSPYSFATWSPALQITTSLSLSSSANPSTYGQIISLTATATGLSGSGIATPTGIVTFYDGATNLGTATMNSLGSATLSTSVLVVATHSLTASYGGDNNYPPSSAFLSQIVVAPTAPLPTQLTLSLTATSIQQGQAVSALVSPSNQNMTPLTGIVACVAGASSISTPTQLSGTGLTTIPLSGFSTGNNTVTCSYSGDPYNQASFASANIIVSPQNTNGSGGTGPAGSNLTYPSYGNIATIAGNGSYGYSGDGGAATSAAMYHADGIVVAPNGDIYFSDGAGSNDSSGFVGARVRKITASTGVVSTVAGNGTSIYSGYTGANGPALSAEIQEPQGLALDAAGNLYIASAGPNCVLKVSATGTISTFAGVCMQYTSDSQGYSGDGGPATNAHMWTPVYLAFDGSGNLFITEYQGCRVRKVTVSTGIITTVAGTGVCGYNGDNQPATSAQIYFPQSIAFDGYGNMYISEFHDRIRMIAAGTNTITTVVGTGAQGYSGDGVLQ